MKFNISNIFCVVFFICCVRAQANLNCESLEKCKECIRKIECVWCSKPKYDENIHCRSYNSISDLSKWCANDTLINPLPIYHVTDDNNLQSMVGGKMVQIKPQKAKLTLRRGQEYTITFQYARASNYPVDLYYLMDSSLTMENHVQNLAKLSGNLVKAIRNSTSDFRLGFGSFVDKFIMPFDQTRPDHVYIGSKDLQYAYSLRNHLPLTDDFKKFEEQVDSLKFSVNLDLCEGGFDALMQVIVCKDQIGWRDNARRLIVFSTDYLYHVAGDGKLAGLYEPNDATCHIVGDEYVKLIDNDYPSVGQLEYIARTNNIHLIFAIPQVDDEEVYAAYKELSENFANSYIGRLSNDSSNVVVLIDEVFQKITHSVHITDNASATVEIKYKNNKCDNPASCTNIHINEVVEFTATIKPLECHSEFDVHQILIKPEGLNEELILELRVNCECDCASQGAKDYIPNSPECSNRGDEVCGVCQCHEGSFGNYCECDKTYGNTTDVSNCRKDDDSEICSGMGTCKCNRCICDNEQRIYGKYCECDRESCKKVRGQTCSGEDHGICECGKCLCLSGWMGEACECPYSSIACVSQESNGEVCSGHGTCVCGECQCENKYSGKYCEECTSCLLGQRCEKFLDCVELHTSNSNSINQEESLLNCTHYNIRVVDEIDEDNQHENVKICREIDQSGCTVIFKYTYDLGTNIAIEVLKERMCPKPLDAFAIVAIIIFSVLIGGLIILAIWKLLTHIHDNREYANFERNLKDGRWNESNPLYQKASTTVVNPLYGIND